MYIRLAKKEELERILEIYEIAKKYMRNEGNKNQWNSAYPEESLLLSDIEKNNLYVVEIEKKVHAVFAYIVGIDETYINIYEGSWLNDLEYGTIHRIASSGEYRGIFKGVISYLKRFKRDIRIDTHRDNITMKKILNREGFEYCGVIYLKNKDERLAYQKKAQEDV